MVTWMTMMRPEVISRAFELACFWLHWILVTVELRGQLGLIPCMKAQHSVRPVASFLHVSESHGLFETGSRCTEDYTQLCMRILGYKAVCRRLWRSAVRATS